MDKFNINDIKDEKDALDQSVALNKIVMQVLDRQKEENKNLILLFVLVTFIFTTLIILLVVSNNSMKTELVEQISQTRTEFINFLNELECETTESYEVTQTVEGEGNDIVNGNQYNDNSVHNDDRK